jgi:hypothetical protein
LKSKSRKCWKNDNKKIKDKLDTKNKWNKNLRGGIEKKSTLKPIKAKQIRIKIDINTNWWTHLILKWMAWNLRWCERKDGGKKNNRSLIVAPPSTCFIVRKRMARCFQRCCRRQRYHTRFLKSTSTLHSLTHMWHAPITFYFLIIFIFVKSLNFSLIAIIITKIPWWKIQKSRWN